MKLKRILTWICLVSMLLAMFACGTPAGPADTSEEESTSVETGGNEGGADIKTADLGTYVLVRPDNCGEDLINACTKLFSALRGINDNKMEIKTDFYMEGKPGYAIGEYEILVGPTNRPESQQLMAGMRQNDYGYALIGKKIVICGGSEAAAAKAVESFRASVVAKAHATDEIFYSGSMDKTIKASYKIPNLTFLETPVENYRIVYGNSEKSVSKAPAEGLADSILKATGLTIEVVSDKTAAESGINEIVVGKTNRRTSPRELKDDEYAIDVDGKTVYIEGNSSFALINAIAKLISQFNDKRADSLNVNPEPCLESFNSEALKAMSFNVLVSNVTDARNKAVVAMVRKYMPDTVGFQEASPEWMSTLKSGLSDVYAYVGEGREGGDKGEYNPIFYNKAKFKLITSGTKWLSDTPGAVSKYSESACYRILTYAILERKADGLQILIVNTHLDHKSEDSRNRQAKVLSTFLQDYGNMPVVLTGDFNTTSSTSCYNTVVNGGMTNSMTVAKKKETASTYTNFGASSKVIDFIFVNKALVSVDYYRVCNENIDGVTPSDHHPVYIEYTAANW